MQRRTAVLHAGTLHYCSERGGFGDAYYLLVLCRVCNFLHGKKRTTTERIPGRMPLVRPKHVHHTTGLVNK